MTNKEVFELMEASARRGHPLTEYQAKVYLQGKEELAKNPDNSLALDVVESFSRFIADGVPVTSFAQFLMPCPETDEEQAEWRKYAELP